MELNSYENFEILGTSVAGNNIELLQLTRGPKNLLLIGGVHGDEPEGYSLVETFVKQGGWRELREVAALYVIPRLNPDGCKKNERRNHNGVDLNRNMPTRDWSPAIAKERYHPGPSAGSEVETQLLIQAIERLKPAAIISAHTYDPMINYNGPAKALAQAMAQLNHYIVTDDIGYPTPGSLGTWAGWERKIPTITLEIERDLTPKKIWEVHGEALLAGFIFAAQNEVMG